MKLQYRTKSNTKLAVPSGYLVHYLKKKNLKGREATRSASRKFYGFW